MAGLMSMAPQDHDTPPNPMSMMSKVSDKTKKDLVALSEIPGGTDLVKQNMQKLVGQPNVSQGDGPPPPPMGAPAMSSNGPATPPQAAALPPRAVTPAPKIQSKNQTDSMTRQETGQKNNISNIDYLNQTANWARNQDEFKDQKSSADRLQAMIDAQGKQSDNSGWIRPLSALSDSQTGSHLLATAPDPQARNAALLKYSDELAKRKNDMMKTIMESASKLKTGQDSTNSLDQYKQGLMTGQGMGGAYGNGLNNRTIATQATAAGKQYDADHILQPLEGSLNNFDKFDSILNGKAPITDAIFNNMQEELTRATRGASGGAVADSAVIRDQMKPLIGEWNRISTNMTAKGEIPDMREQAPALFKQLKTLKDTLRQDFENQYAQRVEQLRHNYDATSDILAEPKIKQASYDKADSLLKARITGGKGLQPSAMSPNAQAMVAQPPVGAPKVGDVIDGHKFLGGDPSKQASWGAI
jgi:hypothetical protein